MSYTDFYIRFEHKFLKNIYTKEELSTHLSTLDNYYKISDKFLTTVILLESVLNSHLTFDEIVSDEFAKILKEKCTDCKKFEDLTEAIIRTGVKHSNKNEKNVKIYPESLCFCLCLSN